MGDNDADAKSLSQSSEEEGHKEEGLKSISAKHVSPGCFSTTWFLDDWLFFYFSLSFFFFFYFFLFLSLPLFTQVCGQAPTYQYSSRPVFLRGVFGVCFFVVPALCGKAYALCRWYLLLLSIPGPQSRSFMAIHLKTDFNLSLFVVKINPPKGNNILCCRSRNADTPHTDNLFGFASNTVATLKN